MNENDKPARCGATTGKTPGLLLVCDREPGHPGHHRGYHDTIDAPMFWPSEANGVMDVVTAWRCVKACADYLDRVDDSPRAAKDLLQAVRVLATLPPHEAFAPEQAVCSPPWLHVFHPEHDVCQCGQVNMTPKG